MPFVVLVDAPWCSVILIDRDRFEGDDTIEDAADWDVEYEDDEDDDA